MHQTSKPIGSPALLLGAGLALSGWLACALLPATAAAQNSAPPPVAAKPGDFRGYSGVHWPSDFDVRKGHCDRERITDNPRRTDAIASLGQRRALNRNAAMLVGAHLPDLLPVTLGAELDEGDRACMGQVLELGASGHWVRWDNSATGIHYEMRPDAGRDGIAGTCRAFRLKASGNYKRAKRTAMACESGPGLWQLSSL
ncbi:MAG TPA: hypothetical protein VGV09_02645 [Steroidobacteraceae bacterium]|nr:hypothetical protein [Steroidobacteraceae bacterium]